MDLEWIDGTDGQAAADALASNHARLIEADVTQFVLAARWGDLHDEASLARGGGSGRVLAGTERAKQYGGDGTPLVGEFAAAELGCLIGRSSMAAGILIADALDVRHRLPAHWAGVLSGTMPVWKARQVASRTRAVGLSLEQARWVDAQCAPYVGSLPWSRFSDLVDAKIVAADPDAAQARADAAAMERFVSTGQCNEYGLKMVIAKANAGDAIFFVAMCDRIAQILLLQGDTDPVGARRSKAFGILANPAQALVLLAQYEGLNTNDHGKTDGKDDGDADADADADENDDEGSDADVNEGAAAETENGGVTDADADADADNEDDEADADADNDGNDDAGEGDPAAGAPVRASDVHPSQDDSDDAAETGCVACGASQPSDPNGPGGAAAFVRALATIDPKKLLPAATLYLHIAAEDFTAASTSILTNHDASTGGPTGSTGAQPAGTGVVRVEGIGPVTLAQAIRFLRHRNVSIRPVIDLSEDHPVDGYEVPARMREQLHLRSPAEVFPWSGNRSRRKDLDHTVPYVSPDTGGPPGQTRIGNLGPLSRYAHRVKTHGRGWRHRQPVPGVFLWRTPHGHWFRVDNTGTHPLGKDPSNWDLAGRPNARTDVRITLDPDFDAGHTAGHAVRRTVRQEVPFDPTSAAEAALAALITSR